MELMKQNGRKWMVLRILLLLLLEWRWCQGLEAHIEDRRLIVDSLPMHLKGVNWNPVPVGSTQARGGPNFRRFVKLDAVLMRAAGVNVVRTYATITDRYVLDELWSQGIQVLNGVYTSARAPIEVIRKRVQKVKDHPAILMWVIGNEWNYNGLYAGFSEEQSLQRIREAALEVKAYDTAHPVSTVYGHFPPQHVYDRLKDVIDVWGLNYYDGASFRNLFERWGSAFEAPMYLAEYGADAFNSLTQQEDQEAQAFAVLNLTEELVRFSSTQPGPGGVCLGGILFEFADEWWKDSKGSPWIHDKGGVAPGGGPHPDAIFNEEWWGIVDIERNPRSAYWAFASVKAPENGAYRWSGKSVQTVDGHSGP